MTTEIDVGSRVGWVERRAKLFEAGDYPDKGISVSEEDLVALVAGFSGEVPVLIEHSESPLELGFLTHVSREGRELHGTVALSLEADALVRRSGARGLSLGLAPDLRSIREVSLVRRPRVSGAGFFSEELLMFSAEFSVDETLPSPRFPLSLAMSRFRLLVAFTRGGKGNRLRRSFGWFGRGGWFLPRSRSRKPCWLARGWWSLAGTGGRFGSCSSPC